jgi:hypothetical protein
VVVSIVLYDTLVIGWDAPANDGCLPITSYTMQLNGAEYKSDISPSSSTLSIDISAFAMGDVASF